MPSNNVFQYSKIRTRKRSAKKSIKTGKKMESSSFWNPESTVLESGIQYTESGIHSMESRIQDCPGFPYMGRVLPLMAAILIFRCTEGAGVGDYSSRGWGANTLLNDRYIEGNRVDSHVC